MEEETKCQEEFSNPGSSVGTMRWRPGWEQPAVESLPPDSCSQEQEPLQFHTTREELEHRSFITSNIIPNSFLSEIRICFGPNNVTSLADVWLIHKVANQITEPSVKTQITRFLTHLFSVFTLPWSLFYPSQRVIKDETAPSHQTNLLVATHLHFETGRNTRFSLPALSKGSKLPVE